MASLNTFKSMHYKDMLLINNYKFMFDKKILQIDETVSKNIRM